MTKRQKPSKERKILSRVKLSRRFGVATAVVVFFIIAAFSIGAYLYSKRESTKRLTGQVENISRIAAASLKIPLWHYQKEIIDDILNAILDEEGVRFVRLTDNANKQYKRSAPGFGNRLFLFFQNSPDFKTKVTEIYHGGNVIGTFQLAISNAGYKEQLLVTTIALIIATVLIIGAISFSSFFITSRYFLNPLKKLKKSVTDITEKGLDVQVDTSARDEFGELAQTFETMRNIIKDKVTELDKLNTELEDKVKSRTKALTQSQDKLKIHSKDLFRSQEKLKTVLDNVRRCVYWTNTNGLIEDGNSALAKDLGLKSLKEIKGRTELEVWKEKRFALTLRNLAKQVSKHGKFKEYDRQFADKDGLPRWFHFYGSPLKDRAGNLTGVLVTYRDVTLERESNEKIERARDEAERANRSKDNFLANVSHEIRTPMNAIIGYTGLLLETETSPYQEERLNRINTGARDLTRVINDILDFSKMVSGKLDILSAPFLLKPLLDDVIDIFKPKTEKKGIKLNVLVEENHEIPDALTGDKSRLKQILNNLVHNAIRFTETGGIDVMVSCKSRKLEQVTLQFQVRDTGCGIPAKKIKKIYDPYTQLDHSTVESSKGIGLGLTISKNLVTLMKGEIAVESKVGEGTKFLVEIRFGIANIEDVLPEPTGKDEDGYQPWQGLNGIRALVAEDDESSRELMKELLEKVGIQVHAVENGAEAYSAAVNKEFDVVLLDMKMPELSGHKVSEKIRKQKQLRKLPIIAVTAHATVGERKKCLEAGMDDYISKPVTNFQLLSMIKKYCVGIGEDASPGSPRKELPPVDKKLLEILKGVDVQGALKDLDLDIPSLIVKLRTVARSYDNICNTIKEAVKQKNTREIRDLLHKIKGSSANHRLYLLQEAVENLRAVVIKGDAVPDEMYKELQYQINNISIAAEKACTFLGITIYHEKDPQIPIDREKLEAIIMEVNTLLKEEDHESKRLALELVPYLNGRIEPEDVIQFKQSTDNWKYKPALDLLKKIAQSLDVCLEES